MQKLLISWAAHTFNEVMPPLLSELAGDYQIVITTTDYYFPKDLLIDFDNMIKNDLIRNYYIIPFTASAITLCRYLKHLTPDLKECEFDLWVTGSNQLVHERYISEYVLPKKCKRIIYWNSITRLFENEVFCKKLLTNAGIPFQDTVKENNYSIVPTTKNLQAFNMLIDDPILFFKKLLRVIRVKGIKYRKWSQQIMNRTIVPMIIFGKVFRMAFPLQPTPGKKPVCQKIRTSLIGCGA